MANLIVRNIDDKVVDALKARAGKHGCSAEVEHQLGFWHGVSRCSTLSLQ